MSEQRQCDVCGCTESSACEGGCAWVASFIDVCTKCVETSQGIEYINARASDLAYASQELVEAIRFVSGEKSVLVKP